MYTWNYYKDEDGSWIVTCNGFEMSVGTRGDAQSLVSKLSKALVQTPKDLIKILAQHNQF